MAAIPFARIARQLAAQGNIKVSKSGMNFSGPQYPCQLECHSELDDKAQPQIIHGQCSSDRIPFHWNVREASRRSYQGFRCGMAGFSSVCSGAMGHEEPNEITPPQTPSSLDVQR
jgi:hypothetical protein